MEWVNYNVSFNHTWAAGVGRARLGRGDGVGHRGDPGQRVLAVRQSSQGLCPLASKGHHPVNHAPLVPLVGQVPLHVLRVGLDGGKLLVLVLVLLLGVVGG